MTYYQYYYQVLSDGGYLWGATYGGYLITYYYYLYKYYSSWGLSNDSLLLVMGAT